jgi:hypothetical protein
MSCGGGHLEFSIGMKKQKLCRGPSIELYMHVHWMVLYKLDVFCSNMKFKMAATAGLRLTLDNMGKMFQNASTLKPIDIENRNLVEDLPMMIPGQFGFNCPSGFREEAF